MKINLKHALSGAVLILLSTFALSAVFAGLLTWGVLPMRAMEYIAWLITFAACFLGGSRAARGPMPLPMALLSGGIYLAAVFVLRGILFQSVGERPLAVVLSAVLGCGIGAAAFASKSRC